jgi:hypothetical protein
MAFAAPSLRIFMFFASKTSFLFWRLASRVAQGDISSSMASPAERPIRVYQIALPK